jgi:predicted transcriptional regulator
MSRKSTYNPSLTVNFQVDRQTHNKLHEVARRQDRSASSLIRLAIRAWLDGEAAASAAAQQHGEQELTVEGAP